MEHPLRLGLLTIIYVRIHVVPYLFICMCLQKKMYYCILKLWHQVHCPELETDKIISILCILESRQCQINRISATCACTLIAFALFVHGYYYLVYVCIMQKLKKECRLIDECVAFTSEGGLKSRIEPKARWKKVPSGGMYVADIDVCQAGLHNCQGNFTCTHLGINTHGQFPI